MKQDPKCFGDAQESGFSLPSKPKSAFSRMKSSPVWSPKRPSKSEDPPAFDLNGDSLERPSFIVLGSGCYRIGASVEFDWSSVSAVRTCFGAESRHNLKRAACLVKLRGLVLVISMPRVSKTQRVRSAEALWLDHRCESSCVSASYMQVNVHHEDEEG